MHALRTCIYRPLHVHMHYIIFKVSHNYTNSPKTSNSSYTLHNIMQLYINFIIEHESDHIHNNERIFDSVRGTA